VVVRCVRHVDALERLRQWAGGRRQRARDEALTRGSASRRRTPTTSP
jgi:hypothetical protein